MSSYIEESDEGQALISAAEQKIRDNQVKEQALYMRMQRLVLPESVEACRGEIEAINAETTAVREQLLEEIRALYRRSQP